MVKHILVFLCLSLAMASSWAVKFESSVDRKQVGEGESLVLTVRYNSNLLSDDPDFSPVKQQFTLYNQQRKSSFQFINGKSDSWTVWTLTLIPKRKGNLVIPALSFKGENSKAIQIQVTKISDSIKSQQQSVFFDTSTDIKSAYVQGQILYTEKLYFSVNLDNSQLNEVVVDEAVVQSLGEVKHYATQLNGRSLEVYERQFVITPQTSGEMIIPGPIYSGEISNGRWRAGRPVRITHPPIKIQVLPQPASYPVDATWLPANDVSLDYKWNGNPQKFRVGEPLTVQLEFTAKGLSSAQLPVIKLPEVIGLKYYPDQAETQDMADSQGIIGTRKQSIAIVATRAGNLTLPEVRIPWWNTKLARLEYAVIPALRLTALTNPNKNTEDSGRSELPSQPKPDVVAAENSNQAAQETSLLWPIICVLLLILWLATLALWWFKSRSKPNAPAESVNQTNNKASLKDIKQACRNNDPTLARAAILQYAQSQWQFKNTSLNGLAKSVTDPSLQQALLTLDTSLYSPQENNDWQGEPLWQVLKHYRHNQQTTPSGILPLYPNETIQKVAQHG
ncbi:MAG: BatD family protein [Bermanella sp.]